MDAEITTLTPIERVQLVNQFLILEKLYPDDAKDYAEYREIIARGYTKQYAEVFGIVADEVSIEDCTYVYDVLDMYRRLIFSYEALTDKEGLTTEDVEFLGFDGNNETRFWAFAEHLQKQDKWKETLKGDLDNHGFGYTDTRYPKMLEKFKPMKEQVRPSHGGTGLLTAEQIKQIIS